MIYVLKKKKNISLLSPGTKTPLNTRNGTEQQHRRQVGFL